MIMERRSPVISNHQDGYAVNQPSKVNKIANTKLLRVELKSKENPKIKFTNLGHILSEDFLKECFHNLDKNKAVGTDKVTKEEYGKELEINLKALLSKIRNGSYYPKPTRTAEIPKSDGTKRPLSIACFEDKIVQEAARRILEPIFEPHFYQFSFGFRPNKNCHQALAALDKDLMNSSTKAVLDVDIKKCFPSIPNEPLINILSSKIGDKRFLNLLIKLIKSKSIDIEGKVVTNQTGTPQGSILSPLLANIYLHEVVDKWFVELNKNELASSCTIVRYADDMIFTAKSLDLAERLRNKLKDRLNTFGLELHEIKTKVISNGKLVANYLHTRGYKIPKFTFLGFLHVWGKSFSRKTNSSFWRVKRKTCPLRFRAKIKLISEHFNKNMHRKDFFDYAKRIVNGYLEYFAINDNRKRITQFVEVVKSLMFKCLNRRSQKRSFNWKQFSEVLKRVDFPKPLIRHSLIFNSSAYKRC
ncbi:group II intron reverse transcriptase/maturase [Silvanigrella sp.]|jgi:RNA-directed DNA polymerase|uniref:group II intron reverse transcriptase/maturase n=1 Tax=Silvanigrella sp. TaxID=2024976 RepID=UPI0037C7D268